MLSEQSSNKTATLDSTGSVAPLSCVSTVDVELRAGHSDFQLG